MSRRMHRRACLFAPIFVQQQPWPMVIRNSPSRRAGLSMPSVPDLPGHEHVLFHHRGHRSFSTRIQRIHGSEHASQVMLFQREPERSGLGEPRPVQASIHQSFHADIPARLGESDNRTRFLPVLRSVMQIPAGFPPGPPTRSSFGGATRI